MGKVKPKTQGAKVTGQKNILSYFSAKPTPSLFTTIQNESSSVETSISTSAERKTSSNNRVVKSSTLNINGRVGGDSLSSKDNTIGGGEKRNRYNDKQTVSVPSRSVTSTSSNDKGSSVVISYKISNLSTPQSSHVIENSDCEIISDSDCDIIACTPDPKKRDKESVAVTSKCEKERSCSPEMILATPQMIKTNNVSKHFQIKESFKSKARQLVSPSFVSSDSRGSKTNPIKPGPISIKNKFSFRRSTPQNSKQCDRNTDAISLVSGKRSAITGTGISPNAKRNIVPDNISKNNLTHCRSDLLGKFSEGSCLDCTSDSNQDGSFSIMQRKLTSGKVIETSDKDCDERLEHKLEEMEFEVINNLKNKSHVSILEQKILSPHRTNVDESDQLIQEEIDNISEIMDVPFKEDLDSSQGFSAANETDDKKHVKEADPDMAGLEGMFDEPFDSSQGFSTDSKQIVKNGDANVPDMEDVFEDSLDHLFCDELTADLGKLSPFKKPPKEEPKENKEVKKQLAEGVGSESYCHQGNFGRHLVTGVERDPYKRELFLRLVSPLDQTAKTCSLTGFWSESAVSEGDVVHILFVQPVDGHFTVDNNVGLIVIQPDFLVSGTSVVAGVFCRRKAVLNERFKGIDTSSQIMLIGSLVHQLFQEVVKKKLHNYDDLKKLMLSLLSESRALRDMYGLGLSVEKMLEEMTAFLPHIQAWSQRYLSSTSEPGNGKPQGKAQRRNHWEGKITDILDIEENLWSPRFGVKGKIDMTVQVQYRGPSKLLTSKVLPLELKTGRSSFSAEHKGQLTLYSMMTSDRRRDPQGGLLLYLRDGAMEAINAGEKEMKGLVQLRNDLVQHLTARAVPQSDDQIPQLPSLPEPIEFERACVKCPHLVTCSVYQVGVECYVPPQPHPMASLVPTTIAHLSQSHLEYFRHWCLLLHLEMASSKKGAAVRALWCQDPLKRESSGDCLSNLKVDGSAGVSEVRVGEFVQVLHRVHSTNTILTPLSRIGLQVGDSIVVSSKTEIALSMGAILSVQNDSVTIAIDRDLCEYPDWRSKVFHVDRYEYQNTMGSVFTNLARLLMDTTQAAKLRTLLVDKDPPSFKKGLSPEIVSKGRHILKNLNKTQQRAVLKTLMSESYSLLQGYPGTGKTSTIVALVRMMVTLGLSVLVTSYTHSAVDNILLKLKECEVDFLRLGRTSRIHSDLLLYAEEVVTRKFTDIPTLSQFYDSKMVVASTCLGVNHVLFAKRKFDFCIIDEASQVLQAAALGPLFHASRFVLVGDPKQLPPLVQSKQARNLGMCESLFMRLDSKEATSDLREQYRMNGPIMRLANELTYNNQLQCASPHIEKATLTFPGYRKLVSENSISSWVGMILKPSLEQSVVFVDTCGTANESRDRANHVVNTREVELVTALLQTLVKGGVETDDIGVIAPYRGQVKLLREWLGHEGVQVEVNTVDQYQGRDKSVVVYSCVRTGASQADPGDILQDESRLNVALTRAKHKLIMVGNITALRAYQPFSRLLDILLPHQTYQLREGVQGFVWHDSVSY